MTDHLTDRLFDVESAARVVYPVSRLVVDPERFDDDLQEPMSARGMGVIYELTSTGARLREKPSPDERESLLARFYRPHHEALARAVKDGLAGGGPALIIDCHSFPSAARPFELDPEAPRPDLNLGTDPFHTPADLTEHLRAAAVELGWTVAVDRPYRGTIVPASHHRRDDRVKSIMLEVNRRLYLDEATGFPGSGFTRARRAVSEILEAAARFRSVR